MNSLLNTTGFMCFASPHGEAQDQHHQQWFLIDSCSFGVTSQIKSPMQDVQNGTFSQIEITRRFDDASIENISSSTYKYVGDCKIHFSKIGDSYDNPRVEIILKNSQIISHRVDLTTKEMRENFSLHFTRIEMNYFPENIDGKVAGPRRFAYTPNEYKKGR